MNSFVFRNIRPWPNKRLDRAAIVGHTTSSTAKIWVRTGLPGEYYLIVYPMNYDEITSARSKLKQVPFDMSSLPNWMREEQNTYKFEIKNFVDDTTHVQLVDHLQPLTTYGYALIGGDDNGNIRVLVGQDNLEDPLAFSFRTLSMDNNAPFSFGFFSCHMPYEQSLLGNIGITNMDMWHSFLIGMQQHREKNGLAFLIGGGDQVYVDGVKGLSIWKYLNKNMRKEGGQLLPNKDDMLSWYRDIYRGYWGFSQLQAVFSQFPTYMICDDHELCDGWGSYFLEENSEDDEMNEILPDWNEKGLSWEDCNTLLANMKECALKAYNEYQHSHNPDTDNNRYDYGFITNGSAFYFLDERTNRDINRAENRILGKQQLERFATWLGNLDINQTPYVFVVSTVPLLHFDDDIVNIKSVLVDPTDLEDDLRDEWEHELHRVERKQLVELLFEAATRGLKISILSGDVHMSAAFHMKRGNTTVYQLTSSAITFHVPRLKRWVLCASTIDEGYSPDGYHFKRLTMYTKPNFSLIKVHPTENRAEFQLFSSRENSHQSKVIGYTTSIELSF